MTEPGNTVNAEAIRVQLGSAYDRFGADERSRHVELLRSIRRPEDIGVWIETAGDGREIVTVCTSDCVGALSIVAGLFTAYRLDIVRANVFTLHFAEPPERAGPPRRVRRRSRRYRPAWTGEPSAKILDVFEVRAPETPVDASVWQRFREDLADLVARLVKEGLGKAREEVIDRVTDVVPPPVEGHGQLLPLSIDLSNDASPSYTRLSIRGVDTLGFLFAFSNALAMSNVNIGRAEIRTVRGEVDDTFWLTDAKGRKIVDERRIHQLRVAAVLIKHFTHLLPRSPDPGQALRQFTALTQQMLSRADWTQELRDLESPAVLELLAEMLGVSQFLWEDFLRMQHESLFPVLTDMPALGEHKSRRRLRDSYAAHVRGLTEHGDRVRGLNRFKDREMFRIDLRHVTRRMGFRGFSEELTELAEVVVEKAADLCHTDLESRFGTPTLDDARPCPWCICALGKFGGREPGFASDVELILVYEGEGTTTGPTPIENSRFFGDFMEQFSRTVTTRREGIFEIDLRLRPHGNAGALASTLGGFARYYSHAGAARQFERMALVKLRPVAGDAALGSRVVEARDEFVYSTAPLDVENVLHLRRRQATELVPHGAVSAKHSPGGLVDLEYFVQVRQIAAGHADPSVRVTNTREAIDRLARLGHLSSSRAEELRESYRFLRHLIDALRAVRGHAKDLTIPASDSREFAYLTQRLRFGSIDELHDEIAARMAVGRSVWDRGVSADRRCGGRMGCAEGRSPFAGSLRECLSYKSYAPMVRKGTGGIVERAFPPTVGAAVPSPRGENLERRH